MGISEVALFTAGQQFATAVAAYPGRITPPPKNIWAAAAVSVGIQLAENAAAAFGYGVVAANAELATAQAAEATVATQLGALPPIT